MISLCVGERACAPRWAHVACCPIGAVCTAALPCGMARTAPAAAVLHPTPCHRPYVVHNIPPISIALGASYFQRLAARSGDFGVRLYSRDGWFRFGSNAGLPACWPAAEAGWWQGQGACTRAGAARARGTGCRLNAALHAGVAACLPWCATRGPQLCTQHPCSPPHHPVAALQRQAVAEGFFVAVPKPGPNGKVPARGAAPGCAQKPAPLRQHC